MSERKPVPGSLFRQDSGVFSAEATPVTPSQPELPPAANPPQLPPIRESAGSLDEEVLARSLEAVAMDREAANASDAQVSLHFKADKEARTPRFAATPAMRSGRQAERHYKKALRSALFVTTRHLFAGLFSFLRLLFRTYTFSAAARERFLMCSPS